MRKCFEPSLSRRATVWLDEPPRAEFTPESVVRGIVQPTVVRAATHGVAAVELSVYFGPRASYALLGCELIPSSVDGLEVAVASSESGGVFESGVALQPDEVRVGLPAEFVEAVLRGVSNAASSFGAPRNACLMFRWAAHGVVGSSVSSFERVAGMVVRLLSHPTDAPEEQLVALLRA